MERRRWQAWVEVCETTKSKHGSLVRAGQETAKASQRDSYTGGRCKAVSKRRKSKKAKRKV